MALRTYDLIDLLIAFAICLLYNLKNKFDIVFLINPILFVFTLDFLFNFFFGKKVVIHISVYINLIYIK